MAGLSFLGGRPTLWVTEGPLKADVAAHRLSVPVLGVAGVANWRKAVPVVQESGAERVILAFGQDEREGDPEGRRAQPSRNLAEFREVLKGMGVQAFKASWGKGIDDALALGQSIKVR